MKKIILPFLLICVSALFPQTDLSEKFHQEFQINESLVKQYIQQNGLERYKIETDGSAWMLISIRNGQPVYYITNNANAAATVSTNRVHPGGGAGVSLTGSGIDIGEWDGGGVLLTHNELSGRVIQSDSPAGLLNHSTHVAGTLIATGNTASAKGMAYLATIQAYDFNNDETEMALAAENRLILSNHSYGVVAGWHSGTFYGGATSYPHWFGEFGEQEDYQFGFYGTDARDWDEIANTYPYYLIVNSAGNDRNDNAPAIGSVYYRVNAAEEEWVSAVMDANGPFHDYHENGFDTIPTKGNAKNILTIGSVGDIIGGYNQPSTVIMSSYSCWGPTDDGRIKPDIVSNGEGLYSCNSSGTNNYYTSSGTSMSSPNACGSMALLQQYYKETHNNNLMKAATLKALVIHTADEAGSNPGPDYSFGWGLMNTETAVSTISDDATSEVIREDNLQNGQNEYLAFQSDGSEDIKVTICWTDSPGTTPAQSIDPVNLMLVDDLDIRIYDSSRTTYYPWTLNPANPSVAAQSNSDNFRDNVEQVFIANPQSGRYLLEISHKGTLNPSRDYSLIITGMSFIEPDVSYSDSDFSSELAPDQTSSDVLTVANESAGYLQYQIQVYGTNRMTGNVFPLSLNNGRQRLSETSANYPGDNASTRDETILSYCSDLASGIGTNGAATWISAIRFTSAELATYYDNYQIEKIEFMLNSTDLTSIIIKVWEGGSSGNPGSEVYSQSYTGALIIGSWLTHQLSTPVNLVSGNEYWVGYQIAATADYPSGADSGPMISEKGGWIYLNSSWEELSDYSMNKNWMIRAIIDIAPVNWLSLSSMEGEINGSGNDQITLNFDSTGLSLGTHQANISVTINDIDQSVTVIPVSLTVSAQLSAPLNLQITESEGGINLTWAEVPGATQYKIFYSETPDVFSQSVYYISNTNSYTDSNFSGSKKFYRVTAQ